MHNLIVVTSEKKLSGEKMAELQVLETVFARRFPLQGEFSSMDKNRNGVLSMAELENVFNLMGITDNKTVKAIIA